MGFWWVFCLGAFLVQLDDYVKDLRTQFPGQSVLFTGDIMKILGKTKRSIEGLIVRNALPFQPQKLGGRWCVPLLDVAHWLYAGEQVTKIASPVQPTASSAPRKQTSSIRPSGRISLRDELARLKKARTFQAFCNKLSLLISSDEQEFLAEMLSDVFPSEILRPTMISEGDYWYRVEEADFVEHRLVVTRTTHYLGVPDSPNAAEFLSTNAAAMITFSLGSKVIAHAYRLGQGRWMFSKNFPNSELLIEK